METQTRLVNGHEINAANAAIRIDADAQDASNGNASHKYFLSADPTGTQPVSLGAISFQHGPIKENGVNGITNEALLVIVADRLRGFQSSQYSCRENALALTKIEEALHWLHSRTRSREARGVEGTNTK
jgi:hypothetical protein